MRKLHEMGLRLPPVQLDPMVLAVMEEASRAAQAKLSEGFWSEGKKGQATPGKLPRQLQMAVGFAPT